MYMCIESVYMYTHVHVLCIVHVHLSHNAIIHVHVHTVYNHTTVPRLNDVSIHWNSVCQLLSETLQTLDAVYRKLVLINDITLSEQEWITALGALMANKQTTRGVVEVVRNEVELFKVHYTCTCRGKRFIWSYTCM